MNLTLVHNIPPNAFWLKIPLSSIKKEDLAPMIALILIITHHDKAKVPGKKLKEAIRKNLSEQLKEPLLDQSQSQTSPPIESSYTPTPIFSAPSTGESKETLPLYYAKILTKVQALLEKTQAAQTTLVKGDYNDFTGELQGSSGLQGWISAAQINLFFRNNNVYNYLNVLKVNSDYLNLFFQCALQPASTGSLAEKTLNLDIPPEQIESIAIIIAFLLPQTESNSILYKQIIGPIERQAVLAKFSASPKLGDFVNRIYSNIYNNMSLKEVLLVMNLEIPLGLDKTMKELLELKIKDVPGLKNEQMPEFLFYLSLIIWGIAPLNSDSIKYTTAQTELNGSLKSIANLFYSEAIKFKSPTPISTRTLVNDKRFQNIFFSNSLSAVTLACLDNCKPLRDLLGNFLHQSVSRPIPLVKTDNPFLLGVYFELNGAPLDISADEASKLHQKFRKRDQIKDTASSVTGIISPNSPDSETSNGEMSPTISPGSTPSSSSGSEESDVEMSLISPQEPATPNPLKKEMPSKEESLATVLVIDYAEINKFLISWNFNDFNKLLANFRIQNSFNKSIEDSIIQALLKIMRVKERLDRIVRKLSPNIKLNLSGITNTITQIKTLIAELEHSSSPVENAQTYKNWLEFNLQLYIGFQELYLKSSSLPIYRELKQYAFNPEAPRDLPLEKITSLINEIREYSAGGQKVIIDSICTSLTMDRTRVDHIIKTLKGLLVEPSTAISAEESIYQQWWKFQLELYTELAKRATPKPQSLVQKYSLLAHRYSSNSLNNQTSIKPTMQDGLTSTAVDYSKIQEILLQYDFNAPRRKSPPYEVAASLIKQINQKEVKDKVIANFCASIKIDLPTTQQTLKSLREFLEQVEKNPPSKDGKTETFKNWIKFQIEIYTEFEKRITPNPSIMPLSSEPSSTASNHPSSLFKSPAAAVPVDTPADTQEERPQKKHKGPGAS